MRRREADMGAIYDERSAKNKKRILMLHAYDLLKRACGDTCDYCPIVKECDLYFTVEPRKWREHEKRNT